VRRESKGSFVSDAIDLAANLRQQEFDEEMAAAASSGRDMGLAAGELEGAFGRR
jgi:hypothetical protein